MLTNQNISDLSISDIENLFQHIANLNFECFSLGLENSALKAQLSFQKELDSILK